jgi:hypothetical protein
VACAIGCASLFASVEAIEGDGLRRKFGGRERRAQSLPAVEVPVDELVVALLLRGVYAIEVIRGPASLAVGQLLEGQRTAVRFVELLALTSEEANEGEVALGVTTVDVDLVAQPAPLAKLVIKDVPRMPEGVIRQRREARARVLSRSRRAQTG